MTPEISLPTINLPNNFSGSEFESFNLFGALVWQVLFGILLLVAVLFFITVLYHWLRYETKGLISIAVIATNGIVLLLLFGSASTLLAPYIF